MKLAIITCLALFVAVCQAMGNEETIDLIKRLLESRGEVKKTPEFENVHALKSSTLLSKMRELKTTKSKMLAHKHITSHCENAYVELEVSNGDVENGEIVYPRELAPLLSPASERSKKADGECTFHISTDQDHWLAVYVYMDYVGDVPPTCGEEGLGQLTFHGGDSTDGPVIGHACGQFEHFFAPYDKELFITFTPDTPDNTRIYLHYEIISKQNILGSAHPVEDEAAGVAGAFEAAEVVAAAEEPVAAPARYYVKGTGGHRPGK